MVQPSVTFAEHNKRLRHFYSAEEDQIPFTKHIFYGSRAGISNCSMARNGVQEQARKVLIICFEPTPFKKPCPKYAIFYLKPLILR